MNLILLAIVFYCKHPRDQHENKRINSTFCVNLSWRLKPACFWTRTNPETWTQIRAKLLKIEFDNISCCPCQFLNNRFCPSNYSNPLIALSSAVTGVCLQMEPNVSVRICTSLPAQRILKVGSGLLYLQGASESEQSLFFSDTGCARQGWTSQLLASSSSPSSSSSSSRGSGVRSSSSRRKAGE